MQAFTYFFMSLLLVSGDETAEIFPAYAVWDAQAQTVNIKTRIWVYEPEDGSWSRATLAKGLAASVGVESDTPESTIFDQRVRRLIVDNERSKSVTFKALAQTKNVGPTSSNGHATLDMTFKTPSAPDHIEFEVEFEGTTGKWVVPVIKNDGIGIISDIDDTVKITNVIDRKEMMKNTFTRPFKAVQGLSQVYREWAKKDASYHFVSASPWQLQSELSSFLEKHGFPPASYHLRVLRAKSVSSIETFASSSKPHKMEAIAQLLNDFPNKKFILIGDSGEKDPEIYGEICRSHPKRIERILIRKVPGADNAKTRFVKAFNGGDASWQVFETAQDIVP